MERDILDKINRDFNNEEEYIIRILKSLKTELNVGDRVVRCVLHLSKGSLKKFTKTVQLARIDWRDVIDDAETVDFQFNEPFN